MSSTTDDNKHANQANGTDNTLKIATNEHKDDDATRRNSAESSSTQSGVMRKLSDYVGAHTDAFAGAINTLQDLIAHF
mgnify:CR=1 FL=1